MEATSREITLTTSFLDEDPHFDTCIVNGTPFAIFDQEITDSPSVQIDLPEHTVIFLSSVTAKKISVTAHSIFLLSAEIRATEESCSLYANGNIVLIGSKVKSEIQTRVEAGGDISTMGIETRQKELILKLFREGIAESSPIKFLYALQKTCAIVRGAGLAKQEFPTPLAIENSSMDLDLPDVLEFFQIPMATPILAVQKAQDKFVKQSSADNLKKELAV